MPYCRKLLTSLTQLICIAVLVFSSQTNLANDHDKLLLNGIASYQKLGSEYYIASLYLQNLSTNEIDILATPGLKRMKMVVSRDKWRSRHFAEAWLSAININNDKATQQALGKDIFAFTQITKGALYKGDQIIIDHTPSKGTKVRINNTLVLSVKDDKYFAALLRAWIGQRPPSSDFKAHILNKQDNQEADDLHSRMLLTLPKNKSARFAEVAGWGLSSSSSRASNKKASSTKTKSKKEAAKKAELKRKNDAAKKAELKRKIDAAKKAALKRESDLAKKAALAAKAKAAEQAAEKKRLEEIKLAEEAKIAEEKRVEQERKKKRGNPLRNRLREQMYKNVYKAFNQNINRIAQEKVIYPTKSLNAAQQGSVVFTISLNRNGKLQHVDLQSKTSHIALNKAAETAVKTAVYPPLPTQLNDTEEFNIKIDFSLN